MKEFLKIQVGQPFPLFQNSNMEYIDGCVFEVIDYGYFLLAMYFSNMHEEEIKIINNNRIYVRIIEEGDYLLPMIRFGNTRLVFELEFNPFVYDGDLANHIGKTNLVHIVSIESTNNIVQTLRSANLPKKLYSKMIATWSLIDLDSRKNYGMNYKEWIVNLRDYDVLQLWDRAVPVGTMGEK